METRNTGLQIYWICRKKEKLAKKAWKIEEYHRGITRFCGIERRQTRRNNVQRALIMMAIRAFLRFEMQRISTGIIWLKQSEALEGVLLISYKKSNLCLTQKFWKLKSCLNCGQLRKFYISYYFYILPEVRILTFNQRS